MTIVNIPTLGPEYVKDGYLQLDCIVTVVDALRMRDEFSSGNDLLRQNIDEEDIENLVIQQIEFCNIILLNKASEISKDELAQVHRIIRAIQPKADIIECDYGNVDLEKIIHTEKFNFEEVATSAAWIQELEGHHDDDDDDDDDDDEDGHHYHEHHEHHEHHHHHDHHHDEGEAQAGRQVSLRNAGQWYATMPQDELQLMMMQNPQLRRDWDEQYGDRMQKLVFIGQHLDKDQITAALDFCLD